MIKLLSTPEVIRFVDEVEDEARANGAATYAVTNVHVGKEQTVEAKLTQRTGSVRWMLNGATVKRSAVVIGLIA